MERITIDKLENKIEKLLKYYKQYPNEDNIKSIDKIKKDLNNQEYKIAVVANMSSGKSTFINALFGEEVLPAFNHATTDSATFVYSEANIDKRAVIYFNDGRKSVEIKENLEKEIKQYAQKDEECKDEKYKNVEKIELFYPFKNLQTSSSKDFKITFIDTPGPNSTGDGYKEKHKDQTRSVLNYVDLALFMFDYTQLDANLESDEQGLWKTIQKRHDIDKNFDVYFILNKIDYAFDDNFKDIDTKNKNEFIRLKKENWYIHEKKAVEKLNEAAKKHQIKSPKIYPVSSKFELLTRDKNQNWDAQDELEAFQKSHFKRLFENNWEDKCIEYVGISKLENDINSYINSSVKDKILQKIDSQLINVHNKEREQLELRIQVLETPKAEAERNLKQADKFLTERAVQMQKEIKDKSSEIEQKYIKQIENVIDDAIREELTDNVDDMSRQTIAFAQAYALDGNVRLAIKKSKKNVSTINLSDTKVEIEIGRKVNTENIMQEMQKFMHTIFEDYKRNYLDSKSEIKEEYFKFERESIQFFTQYRDELQEQLEKTLDVKIEKIQTANIDYNSTLNIDVKIPNSVLDYSFKGAEYTTVSDSSWYKPWTWGSTRNVKVSDEKHTFSIAPKKLKASIVNSIETSILKFVDIEKTNHKKSIKLYLQNNSDMFQSFRHNKIKEMDKLKEEIKSTKDNLGLVKKQYLEFEKIETKGK